MEITKHTLRLEGDVEYYIKPLLEGEDIKEFFKKKRYPRKLKKKMKKEGRWWRDKIITDLSEITKRYKGLN